MMILRWKYIWCFLFCGLFILFASGLSKADEIDDRIHKLNQTLKANGLPWKAGRTSVSELSPEQRRALLGGPPEPLPAKYPTMDASQEGGTPPYPYSGTASPSWDWRNVGGINWMTPVTNQICGDCWAHATLGSMEVRLRWQKGGTYGYELPINLSERYAVTCSPHGSCSAWNIPGLLDFIQSDGVADEDCLPYSSTLFCSDRCSNWSHRVYKVTSHGTYNGPGETYRNSVMNSCQNFGPLPVWMMVYSDFWDYSGGIYVKSPGATAEGGHFVVIVGWGTSGGVDYWICKNSWGTGWGVDGYFYIRRGTNESRIEEQAYWLTPQNLPNLDDSTPTGWDYPIVPRGDNTATSNNCHVSPTLPGNSNSTYWNVNWKNEGTVEARDNITHLTIDGVYRWWFSISYQPAGYETKHLNYGTENVKGGRHTICFDKIDYDNRVWEYDEYDNTYCRQFVWSPYGLADNTPVMRSAPPKKDSFGYTWYNCDGFSFYVDYEGLYKWWSAVGVLPSNSTSDYDIRLWDRGDYTGSEQGFGENWLKASDYGGHVSDFVIVNRNKAPAGTYYAGVINWNNGTGDFRIEEDTSEPISPRPGTEWNGPYSKISTNVLDVYECYLSPGEYYFYLDQTAGTCDLGMTLYDKETTYATKSEYMAYANSSGDGGDEAFQVTIPNYGYYALIVWKVDSSDYDKASTYRIAFGPPSITVTSPNGGETWYVGDTNTITWDRFGNTGANVKIEISRDGGGSWSTITASTPNNGSYSWIVTSPTSTQCRIRITSTTNPSYTDTSNANFTIAQRSITVTSPNGGETWYVGDTNTITWSSVGVTGNVKIELSRDGGGSWSTLFASTPNDGSEAWTVTSPTSTLCRIRVTSISYPSVSDTSNANFTIATAVPPCEGDFDNDGDVDGTDLAVFAADFGRTDCNKPGALPCEGDFDHDGDVDGTDLATFAADFGRTNCPKK